MSLDLTGRTIRTDPYPHFQREGSFPADKEALLLDWLDKKAPWRRKKTDFYEQYEFSFDEANFPDELNFINAEAFVERIKNVFKESFKTDFKDDYIATAHKLVPGQVIRIHNDYMPGYETHRLMIQLNRDWSQEQGGLLILFNDTEPAEIAKIVLPISRSAFGFEISEKSLHAVSEVHSGNRYTLVYSFFASLP